MTRIVQLMGLLGLAVGIGVCSDQNKPDKPPPPPPKAAAKPPAPKGAAAKGGAAKLGPQIRNPASMAARLYQLNPAEREQALEKMPEPQQTNIRKQLQYYDSLPKDQQQMMVQRAERLDALTPAERREFLQTFQAFTHLPPERKVMVGQALRRLQILPEADRVMRLASPAFRSRFSVEELHMIDKLSEVVLPPI
jgi:Protein of unknown function (DUF3106)